MGAVLQTLSLLTVVLVTVILIWRVLGNSGVPLKRKIPEISTTGLHNPGIKECGKVFGLGMLFRLFVLGASLVIYCIFIEQGNQLNIKAVIENWLLWDAKKYIEISDGYMSYIENGDYPNIVFFPLYSTLLRFVRFIIPNPAAAGLVLSAVLTSFACVYMYKLVCLDYSKETAQLSVVLLMLFPFGFFYGAVMSESAFLLTSVMTLYYIRKGKWSLAGICGLLASLSRSAGVFLVIPAAVQLVEETKLLGNIKDGKIWWKTIKKGLWLLLLPLGVVIYLLINYKVSGNPFYFLAMEEKYWYQVSQPFFKTVASFWDIISGGHYQLSLTMAAFIPGFVCLICAYAVMVYGLTKHKTMYISWLLVSIIVNTTMSWPLSFCRYIAAAVPIYIIIADKCEKNNKLKMAVLMSWGILFGIYLTGYLMSKSIM